jgi:hypothetical protein
VHAGAHHPPSYRSGYVAENGTKVLFQECPRQHPLEGDGLLLLLYDHLWKSDKTKDHGLKCAWLPDSVVYEHNFPRAWYAYDVKAREIQKHPGKMLDARSIYEGFSVETKGCDVVAQFYYKVPLAAGDEQQRTAVEFFTKRTLYDFLHNTKTKPDGVLQKFIIPKGKASSRRNLQIQAVWSPLVTLVYKRTNNHLLNDRSCNLSERSATFDGPPHFSSESQVAVSTQRRIDSICTAVVQHFTHTERKAVVRILLYFKEDDQDRLWLMWASSLRIGGDKFNPVNVRVPVHLAMKVHAADRADTSETTVASGSRTHMDHVLLRSDVALYGMTNNQQLLRMCGGDATGAAASPTRAAAPPSHPATVSARQRQSEAAYGYQSEVPPLRRPVVPAWGASSSSSSPRSPRRPATGNNSSRSTRTNATDGDADSQQLSVRSSAPPPASQRNKPPPLGFCSPRAPFLPTQTRQIPIGVDNERHPLHGKFAIMESEAAANRKNNERSQSNRNRSRPKVLHGVLPDRPMPVLPAARARVRNDLVTFATDALYEAYTTALGNDADAAQTLRIDLAGALRASLAPDDLDALAAVMHLAPTEESDGLLYTVAHAGALGRGRRTDRPAAMLERDVARFFDGLFDSDEGDAIVLRWNEHDAAHGSAD